MTESNSVKKVTFVCPRCNLRKEMAIPTDLLKKHGVNLATIVVNGDCGHNYIAYLDRHLEVRSYQYTDLFFMSELEKIDQELSEIYEEKAPESKKDKDAAPRIFDKIDKDAFQEKAIEFYTVAQQYKPTREPFQLNQDLIDELKSASLQLIAESKTESDLQPSPEVKPRAEGEGECSEKSIKCDYMGRIKKIEKYLIDLEYDYVDGNVEAEVFLMKKARLLQLEMKLENY
ncbi:MAG: hypothetical protein ACFFCS_23350, partial [Candidatus Hodarchaeota archaeon]